MLVAMGQGHEIACKMCAIVMVNVAKPNLTRFIEVIFVNALCEYFFSWRGKICSNV